MSKKVGIFVGSLRAESFSKQTALVLAELLPEEYEPVFVPLGDLELYNQDFDDENRVPDSWTSFRETLGTLDAALFVTPEYNRSVPAVLKNALDIGSRPYGANMWDSMPAAIVSCSPGRLGGFGANHHLRQSLSFLNMPTLAQPESYLSDIHQELEEGEDLKRRSIDFIEDFVQLIERYK